jgi:hypothetical protein
MRGWVVSGLQFTGLQFTHRQASVRYALNGEYSTTASTLLVRDVTGISLVSSINDMPIVPGTCLRATRMVMCDPQYLSGNHVHTWMESQWYVHTSFLDSETSFNASRWQVWSLLSSGLTIYAQ